MKKLFLITTISILAATTASAQAAKSIYFELGGPGLASFNFDTRFGNREDGIGGRIGIGGFSIEGTSAVFVPIGINYIIGKDQRNYFEIGGGVTPTFISEDLVGEDDNFTGTFGHLVFGYRLQPRDGGFTFRAFMCPVFGEGGFIPYYAGLSFGYKFGNGRK
ncbi:MAG TPA: hypothetical protein VFX58_03635 [Chitinophagaceae bacterium]|nr:hypothetical protein [Chitinophagaceae bacterium]